jgi:hypothetical protein
LYPEDFDEPPFDDPPDFPLYPEDFDEPPLEDPRFELFAIQASSRKTVSLLPMVPSTWAEIHVGSAQDCWGDPQRDKGRLA